VNSYTILITTATAIGPILASFIVQYDSNTWRTFNWVCTGLAAATVVAVFFCYPESNFERPIDTVPGERTIIEIETKGESPDQEKGSTTHREDVIQGVWSVDSVPKPLSSIWKQGWSINPSVNLGKAFVRPLILACCPDVILAVYVFGVSLSAQVVLM
jgi:MFS family permease